MFVEDTIFITGFPGFVASRLVKKLASSQTQIFLLVEKRFIEKAMQEVENICESTAVPLENFFLIEGDITQEDLGIAAGDLEFLQQVVTTACHLAAVYDLAVSKETAMSVNVDGTKNVNAFVKSLPKLRRYLYVSTCYVAGKRRGTILEKELEHKSGFRNYYEESKYLAELEVEKLKGEIPLTIVRPSVIVGDSVNGATTKFDGIYFLINYLLRHPALARLINVGNDSVRLNMVPIDFVISAIVAIFRDSRATGKTLQIADPSPLSTAQVFDTLAEVISAKRSIYTPPPKLVEKFLNLSFAPSLTGLPHYAVPYFFHTQNYDSAAASDILALYQISCPHFSSYAKNLVKFARENPNL